MTMRISGHSDDIVCIEGTTAADAVGEVDAIDRDVRLTIGSAFKGGIIAIVSYGGEGCWSVALAPIDEDVPCPWPVRVGVEGYSAQVEIDCPPDTPLTIERRKQAKDNAWGAYER